MKKRIGIFTYMLNNYGAVLQAFALQFYLRSHSDHNIEVIDFTTKQHLRDDRVFKRQSRNQIKNLVLSIWIFIHYFELSRRRKRTHYFKKTYINFSRRFSTVEEVTCTPPVEDVYVSGSDQVFNINSAFSDVYYLKFKKGLARKVAYAPSFGVSEFGNYRTESIISALQDFDHVSCREESGAKFLSDVMGYDVPVVIDPTLLLSSDEWMGLANMPKFKDYICVYDLNGRDDLINIAKLVKKKTGMKIVCITSNLHQHYDVDKIIYDAGPSEFLGLFAKSSYVVTDSFHGTSFAILFNKPFSVLIAMPNTADRLYTLLSRVDQKHRILDKSSLCTLGCDDLYFDEPNVDLSSLRQFSCEYIENAILK